jgi:hypothetical protein
MGGTSSDLRVQASESATLAGTFRISEKRHAAVSANAGVSSGHRAAL